LRSGLVEASRAAAGEVVEDGGGREAALDEVGAGLGGLDEGLEGLALGLELEPLAPDRLELAQQRGESRALRAGRGDGGRSERRFGSSARCDPRSLTMVPAIRHGSLSSGGWRHEAYTYTYQTKRPAVNRLFDLFSDPPSAVGATKAVLCPYGGP